MRTASWLLGWVVLISGIAAAETPEPAATPAANGEITVVVVGLENDDGAVLTALFDSAEAYDAPKDPVRKQKLPIRDGRAEVHFTGLPAGEYALRVVHDENDNGALDTNFMGLPREPFGFSNGAIARFGPPSFDDAKFALGAEPLTLEIEVQEL